jgi:protein-L-isoaspartate O-methyltransferase
MSRTPLDEEAVRALYFELLGRDVESAMVLADQLKGHPTRESLRESILRSDEYLAKNPRPDLWRFLSANLARPAPRIDVDVTAEQLQAVFQRISGEWAALGNSEPHWSVITHDKYRQANFTAHEDEFYKSGSHVASLVKAFAARNAVEIPNGHVLELGCGTGRVTAALAGMFERVTATDVSPGHLQLCREAMAKRGLTNIEYVILDNPDRVSNLPACSFFLSTIVLQHNPPPLIYYLLDWLLSKVQPGGAALFQVPTHTPHYDFAIDEYLTSAKPKDFEMHSFPMHRVFELLHRHGFVPREVVMDSWTGLPGSHTFFATKS